MTRTAAQEVPFTLLIVEDDAGDAEIMLKAVEQADLRAIGGDIWIEIRATAEGALQLLAERPVDLVLSDMVLPGMSGLDLVTKIQEIRYGVAGYERVGSGHENTRDRSEPSCADRDKGR